jgi:hypothetical protein
MDTQWYDAYMKSHDNDDIVHVYQEENEGDQGLRFTVSDVVGLAELATYDVELIHWGIVPFVVFNEKNIF